VIEKELLLIDLQKQLHNVDNEEVKMMLQNLIADVLSEKYAPRIW
jgi:hypothetical protein